ncbi:MAG: hypothetical protein QW304_07785 [Thermoproteota archaeon]
MRILNIIETKDSIKIRWINDNGDMSWEEVDKSYPEEFSRRISKFRDDPLFRSHMEKLKGERWL